MKMNELTGFQRDILVVMADLDHPHGLAIREELTELYPGNVYHGRLYPNLDELARGDLIEKGTKDDRTNEYVLTSDGREAIRQYRAWLKEQVDTSQSGLPR